MYKDAFKKVMEDINEVVIQLKSCLTTGSQPSYDTLSLNHRILITLREVAVLSKPFDGWNHDQREMLKDLVFVETSVIAALQNVEKLSKKMIALDIVIMESLYKNLSNHAEAEPLRVGIISPN